MNIIVQFVGYLINQFDEDYPIHRIDIIGFHLMYLVVVIAVIMVKLQRALCPGDQLTKSPMLALSQSTYRKK